MSRVHQILAIVVLIVAAGCSNAGEPINTPNPDPVCIAAGGLDARLDDLRELDLGTASMDEVRAAAYGVSGAYQTLIAQVRIYGEASMTELAYTVRELQTAAQQLPAGTSPTDAASLLSEEILAVQAAWRTTVKDLGCAELLASAA